MLAKVSKQLTNTEAAIRQRRTPDEVKKMQPYARQLETLRDRLRKHKPSAGDGALANLDRKQRKLLATILEVLQSVLKEKDYLTARAAIMERLTSPGKGRTTA